MLERYGAQAVFDRQPTPREMRRMALVDRIARAYWGKKQAENEAKWADAHPDEWDLLVWVMEIANG